MFKLVECKNPSLLNAINHNRRYSNLSDLKVFYKGDKKFCSWCCENELKSKVMKYCSDKCRNSAQMQFNPQSKDGVAYLLFRQKFKCNGCDYSWKFVIREIIKDQKQSNIKSTWWSIGRLLNGLDYSEEKSPFRGIPPHRGVQVDHVIPVFEGGETFGFDNCQALCVQCHRIKSANEKRSKR